MLKSIKLSKRDGRYVQNRGTYSPYHADIRLLVIPLLCFRVSENNPNFEIFYFIFCKSPCSTWK